MEKRKNGKKKILLLSSLAVLSFGSVGASLAYWASTVSGTESESNGNINIGQGGIVETTLDLSSATNDKILVPERFANDTTTVGKVDLSFDVKWNSADLAASGTEGQLFAKLTGASTAASIEDEDKATVLDLLNCSFNAESYAIVTDATDAITVTCYITLDEPANKAQYDLIANQDVALTFSFEVVAY